jgi:hypothetical protein
MSVGLWGFIKNILHHVLVLPCKCCEVDSLWGTQHTSTVIIMPMEIRTAERLRNSFPINYSEIYIYHITSTLSFVGSSWSWSHVGWIYSYLCIQCLSPLTWVRIPLMRCVHNTFCTTFFSDLRWVGGFLRVLRFTLSIKLIATI